MAFLSGVHFALTDDIVNYVETLKEKSGTVELAAGRCGALSSRWQPSRRGQSSSVGCWKVQCARVLVTL
jgi:hypothetical protein